MTLNLDPAGGTWRQRGASSEPRLQEVENGEPSLLCSQKQVVHPYQMVRLWGRCPVPVLPVELHHASTLGGPRVAFLAPCGRETRVFK